MKKIAIFLLLIVFIVASVNVAVADDGDSDTFEIFGNVPVTSGNASYSVDESVSSTYGWFYQDGTFAEDAYYATQKMDASIQIDLSQVTVDEESSELDFRDFFQQILGSEDNVYNTSDIHDDLIKLIQEDNESVKLYFEGYGYVDDVDFTLDGDILTVTYSDSETSDLYQKGQNPFSPSTSDYANVDIIGSTTDKNGHSVSFTIYSSDVKIA